MICPSCAAGLHRHDRYGSAYLDGTYAGIDAGCPSVAADGNACLCLVRLPRRAAAHCETCTCTTNPKERAHAR